MASLIRGAYSPTMKKVTHNPSQTGFQQSDFRREVYYQPAAEALPHSDWVAPRLSTLPSWASAKRVSVDVETKDPDIKLLGPGVRRPGNRVVGIAFAIEDGPEHYLPMSHEGGGNCEEGPAAVWAYVRGEMKSFRGHILGAKLDYDGDWMADETDILSHPWMDVQVADPLIDELQYSYSLETICGRLGLPGKDETVLRQAAAAYRVDPKAELWKMHAKYVGKYAEVDARRPIQVMRRQEALIESEKIEQIWGLEQQVTPILVKMRRRGVRIDMGKVEVISRRAREAACEYLERVRLETGVAIAYEDLAKASVLAHALSKAGYRIPKTELKVGAHGRQVGGKESVDKAFLDKCGDVGAHLKSAREWKVLDTTFCEQMRRHAIRSADGEYRIHCSVNQMKSTDEEGDGGKGVRYGRTSCTDPNLQQQPVRHDEFGSLWRSIFVADRNAQGWATCDWSQQEPRIVIDACERLDIPGAKEFADEYRKNPALDIHQYFSDITGIVRKIVKNYVNGRLYSMGDLKTCRHIKQPTIRKLIRGEMREVPGPEGQAIIDKFNEYAPWIKGYSSAAIAAVRRNGGHIWTKLRRKLRFRRRQEGSEGRGEYEDEHKAGNKYGQGTAADQMKATMVAADKANIPLQLIVHDEFDFSYGDLQQARDLKELMLTTVKFGVPMKVDLEIGPSWGEQEKVKD